MRILVADKNINFLRMMNNLLKEELKIQATLIPFNIQSILKEYLKNAQKYELIILDGKVPKESIDTLIALQNLNPDVKILMTFPAAQSVYDISFAYKNGASGVLIKPFSKVDLMQKIKELLFDDFTDEQTKGLVMTS